MPPSFNPQDSYFHKAKEQGYRARSAFKLEALNQRYKILKKGDTVLDLGAAPGSFLQYISQVIGEKGIALGVDLQEIVPLNLDNVFTSVVDITDFVAMEMAVQELEINSWDVVTSDLAPRTSGIKDVDHARSIELNEAALEVVTLYLRKGGNMVLKVFDGEDFGDFVKKVRAVFSKVHCHKPQAVRKSSRELYVVGKGFKGESEE